MGDEVLTIREVADYLKVNEKTVYGLAQKHRIPAFKVGGQWRFRREDIEAWIQAQTGAANGGLAPIKPRSRGRARQARGGRRR